MRMRFLLLLVPLWGTAGLADEANAPQTEASALSGDAAADAHVEEMTVVGKRLLTVDEQRALYRDLAKAKRLFSTNQVDEAFPYLLRTARHGFKGSQATVGHIYLQGLGVVERDSEQAVGWLGVAASGSTSPSIRNYFQDIWQRVPERYVPHFEEVVEEYRSKYGERATGVVCDMRRPLRSHMKSLGCFFEKELEENVRVTLRDIERQRGTIDYTEQERRDAQLQTLRDQLRTAVTNR